jgi:hypothetical protein
VRIIDQLRQPTLDFATGQPTTRLYTRAKIVDMIFFIEGGYPRRALDLADPSPHQDDDSG